MDMQSSLLGKCLKLTLMISFLSKNSTCGRKKPKLTERDMDKQNYCNCK